MSETVSDFLLCFYLCCSEGKEGRRTAHARSARKSPSTPTRCVFPVDSELSIHPPGALSAYSYAPGPQGPNSAFNNGSDCCRAWHGSRRKTRESNSSTSGSHHSRRSLAAAILFPRWTATSVPISFHLQYILQRALARSGNLRCLHERV